MANKRKTHSTKKQSLVSDKNGEGKGLKPKVPRQESPLAENGGTSAGILGGEIRDLCRLPDEPEVRLKAGL